MRELLYISDTKLERFINDKNIVPKDLLWDVQLSVMNIVKVKVSNKSKSEGSSSARIMRKVEQVVAHIENSDNPALWWSSDEVRVGRWIQIDSRLSFAITEHLFLAWCSGAEDEAYISDSSEPSNLSDPVLILHGSAHHVVGSTELRERQAWARRIGGLGGGSEPSFPRYIEGELEPFLSRSKRRKRLLAELVRRNFRFRRTDHLGQIYGYLLYLAERFEFDNLSGFARVTGVYNIDIMSWEDERKLLRRRLVLASPLYVERIVAGLARH